VTIGLRCNTQLGYKIPARKSWSFLRSHFRLSSAEVTGDSLNYSLLGACGANLVTSNSLLISA